MSSFTEIDQNTGRRMIRMSDRRFEIMLQKEKDQFYLETGVTTEQNSKFLKKHQDE